MQTKEKENTKKVYQLGLDKDVLTLIKLSKRHNIKNYVPTNDQIILIERSISGYYDLSEKEIRSIDDFLKTEEAQGILKEAVSLIEFLDSDDEKKYLNYISGLIFNAMPDGDLKSKIKPETIYETVMNLGVTSMHRSSIEGTEDKKPPIYLLKHDPNMAKNVIERQMSKMVQDLKIEELNDFEKAKIELRKLYEEWRQYANQ